MVTRTALLLSLVGSASAFTGAPLVSRPVKNVAPLYMGGASGFATSLDGKKAVIESVQGLLESSEMIFTVPVGGVTVADSQSLRRSMPEGTHIKVVKNKLMERAVKGTDYEAATSMLSGANMWFFIEEDIGGTIKAYNSYLKDTGKKDTHSILGGVMEATTYDSAGVAAIGKLPSKQDLYAQIAGSIKAVPTKVARVIKAPNSKLARAIKLATEENSE